MIASDKGGSNNLVDCENILTGASGALYIQIKKKLDRGLCAGIFLNRSRGYGTYSVTAADTSHLEPGAVFNLFTFEEWAYDQHYCEMDAEVGRRSDDTDKNAEYVIQPFCNKSEVTNCGRTPHVFVSGSLLLVAPLTSDRDGDR
jgi:hypothetical protein